MDLLLCWLFFRPGPLAQKPDLCSYLVLPESPVWRFQCNTYGFTSQRLGNLCFLADDKAAGMGLLEHARQQGYAAAPFTGQRGELISAAADRAGYSPAHH